MLRPPDRADCAYCTYKLLAIYHFLVILSNLWLKRTKDDARQHVPLRGPVAGLP